MENRYHNWGEKQNNDLTRTKFCDRHLKPHLEISSWITLLNGFQANEQITKQELQGRHSSDKTYLWIAAMVNALIYNDLKRSFIINTRKSLYMYIYIYTVLRFRTLDKSSKCIISNFINLLRPISALLNGTKIFNVCFKMLLYCNCLVHWLFWGEKIRVKRDDCLLEELFVNFNSCFLIHRLT